MSKTAVQELNDRLMQSVRGNLQNLTPILTRIENEEFLYDGLNGDDLWQVIQDLHLDYSAIAKQAFIIFSNSNTWEVEDTFTFTL